MRKTIHFGGGGVTKANFIILSFDGIAML